MSEHFRGYPDYIDSAVKWIGSVPAHWEPLKFKRVISEKRHTSSPDLPAGSISFGEVVYKDSEALTEDTKSSYQEILPGEFLVNPLNLNFDLKSLRTALSDIAVVVSTGYLVLRNGSRLDKRYTRWLLQEFDVAQMKTLGAGVRQTISFTDIGNSTFFAPSIEEQTQIGKFLDYETAKIDALIEKQQQLIDLLGEQRQAVISHAVTKGLNPDVPMRDSGVEWLGEVPAHWAVPHIGYVARVFNGSTPSRDVPQYWVDEGIPWLSSGKVNEEIVQEPSSWISKRALAECSIELAPKGSVIVGMIGQGKTRATCAMLGIESTINQNMAAVVAGQMLDSRYLYRVMTAAYDDLRLLGRGANQPALNCDILRAYKIPLPPIEEQRTISGHTQEMLQRTGRTMELAARQRELLQERRTALISAAVTGKIDVRDWKAPESAVEEEVA